MLIVNTNDVPGKKIQQVLGLVRGSTIQSKHIGKDFMAGLKTIVGGEITQYTEMLERAREVALERMIKEAKFKGATAVINVRFTTSAIMQGAAELMVYGTAVIIEE